jgi:hypothetical protein
MELYVKLYERYSDPNVAEDQRPTQAELAAESGVPQTVLSFWFRRFEEESTEPKNMHTLTPRGRGGKPGKDRLSVQSNRTTAKEALKSISERTKSTYEQVLSIGDLVIDKYGDLVKIALESGVKLEDFMADVFNWYEQREEEQKRLRDMEHDLAELRELTLPNYIFKRKSQCILEFANTCAALNKSGAHIPIKQAARALQNDLDRIDAEISGGNQTVQIA